MSEMRLRAIYECGFSRQEMKLVCCSLLGKVKRPEHIEEAKVLAQKLMRQQVSCTEGILGIVQGALDNLGEGSPGKGGEDESNSP